LTAIGLFDTCLVEPNEAMWGSRRLPGVTVANELIAFASKQDEQEMLAKSGQFQVIDRREGHATR
jgi:hypothetical protein